MKTWIDTVLYGLAALGYLLFFVVAVHAAVGEVRGVQGR